MLLTVGYALAALPSSLGCPWALARRISACYVLSLWCWEKWGSVCYVEKFGAGRSGSRLASVGESFEFFASHTESGELGYPARSSAGHGASASEAVGDIPQS